MRSLLTYSVRSEPCSGGFDKNVEIVDREHGRNKRPGPLVGRVAERRMPATDGRGARDRRGVGRRHQRSRTARSIDCHARAV